MTISTLTRMWHTLFRRPSGGEETFVSAPAPAVEPLPALDADPLREQACAAIERMAHEALTLGSDQPLFPVAASDQDRYGLIVTDADHRIRTVNEEFTRIFGYVQDEIAGQLPGVLYCGHHGAVFYHNLMEALLRTGYWEGEIWARHKDGHSFATWLSSSAVRDEHGHIDHYLISVIDMTARKEIERIQFLAQYDSLTNLPKRTLLQERLGEALAQGRADQTFLGVLFIDIDRFRTINDAKGHAVGDRLLQAVAKRLGQHLSPQDMLARQSADEFIAALVGHPRRETLMDALRQLTDALSEPYLINGQELSVTFSVGVSISPDDPGGVHELISNAEAAMRHAKRNGRNRHQLFTSAINTDAAQRLVLEQHLAGALERQEFQLQYQPQVTMPDARVVGCEALIRWFHPEMGLVPPNRFIPVAEETGLIVDIGRWVLQEACCQFQKWREQGIAPARVSVNVSALQLQQPDFVRMVAGVLEAAGMAPSMLELELTESFFMADIDKAIAKFSQLAEMGVQLAIDDFGTGYSSLSYLRRLQLHRLKIDRSFIQDVTSDPNTAAITRAIITMAHSLRMEVIAEGVETDGQMAFLQANGCAEAQGYLFSRPLPAPEMRAWLAARSPAAAPVR